MNTDLINHKKNLNSVAELGWSEKKTTEYILHAVPLKPLVNGFGTSKTGLLYRLGKGKSSILLRADIDALKTQDGPKHICGHSSHTASLLQVLIELSQQKQVVINPDKSVYFLFQPAEETFPSGAAAFVESYPDIMKRLTYAFATHVRPLMKAGEIGLQEKAVMARGDYFEITIKGRMSHVKNPKAGADAIEAGSHLVLACKSFQKKYYGHLRLNVGIIHGGLQANTVADTCVLKGDIRLDSNKLQRFVRKNLESMIKKAEKQTGTTISLNYYNGYPVLANAPVLTRKIKKLLMQENVPLYRGNLFSFGCEDFSFISDNVPSLYAFVGTGDTFDIHDEKCTISDAGTYALYQYFSLLAKWWFSL